jgi:nucleotide-binding universal stress UspA family protein
MAFKHLLLDLDGLPEPMASRELALELARAHDAVLTALYIRTIRERTIPSLSGAMVASELAAEFRRMAETQSAEGLRLEREALDRFMRAAAAAGVTADHAVEVVTDGESAVPHLVRYGRTADAIVLGRAADGGGTGADASAIHDVVFGAGVPVIIVPQMPFGAIGHNVVVAWNGSRESARAVQDALPILERSRKATVVCVDQAKAGSNTPPGAELARYLGCHGIAADLADINDSSLPVGDTILAHIKDIGADLLVMGAYGHSRLREFVLGGVTKRILERTPVPVLMSH